MIRYSFVALSMLMLAAAPVFADVPLPKDLKNIDPRVRFEGIGRQTDHVFYLRYLTFSGNPVGVPHTLRALKDSETFSLNAQRRLSDMHLLAMDKKEFEKRQAEDSTLKWFTDKTPGVLRANLTAPPITAKADVKEVPVTIYRVTLKDGKLSAEVFNREKPKVDATPGGLMPLWAFGILGALSLASFGIWAARRRTSQP